MNLINIARIAGLCMFAIAIAACRTALEESPLFRSLAGEGVPVAMPRPIEIVSLEEAQTQTTFDIPLLQAMSTELTWGGARVFTPNHVQFFYTATPGETGLGIEVSTDTISQYTYPSSVRHSIAGNGITGECIQGSWQDGEWDLDADVTVLYWTDAALTFRMSQSGLGYTCEEMVQLGETLSPSSGTPLAESDADRLYLLQYRMSDQGYQYELVVYDAEERQITRQIEVGGGPSATRAAGGETIYLFDYDLILDAPTLSALNVATGTYDWQIPVPDLEYAFTNALPIDRIWPTEDENTIYVMVSMYSPEESAEDAVAQIATFDVPNQQVAEHFSIPLPYSTVHYPIHFWEVPWADVWLIAQNDQLFSVTLSTSNGGDTASTLEPSYELSSYGEPLGGVIDPTTQRLLLATKNWELLVIDVSEDTFSIQEVIQLPAGYEFFLLDPVTFQHGIQTSAYVLVWHQRDTNTGYRAMEADELWVYDPEDWSLKARVDLRTVIGRDAPDLDFDALQFTDVAYLPAQGCVYIATSHGVLQVALDIDANVLTKWLPLEQDGSLHWARYGTIR